MKKILILLCLASTIYGNDYESAFKKYKNKEYIEAIDEFNSVTPTKKNQDDIWYYIGRSNEKLKNYDMALTYYNKTFTTFPKSSKSKLAFLYSVRILDEKKNYEEISNIFNNSNLDFTNGKTNDIKILPIVAEALYRSSSKHYGNEYKERLESSGELYKLLTVFEDKDYSKELFYIHAKLYNSGFNSKANLDLALFYGSNLDEEKINKWLYKKSVDHDLSVKGGAAYSDSFNPFGDLSYKLTINSKALTTYSIQLKSSYDPNSFKSFNYKTTDEFRFLQWGVKSGGVFSLTHGSSRNLKHSLNLGVHYNIFEDDDDNSISADGAYKLEKRFAKGRVSGEAGALYKDFTVYTSTDKDIDFTKSFGELHYLHYLNNFSVGAGYKLSNKYYLNWLDKYEGDKNRYYLTHKPYIDGRYKGSNFTVKAEGFVEVNDSYNYTKKIDGKLYSNYWNYTEPGGSISITVEPMDIFSIKLGSDFSYRLYSNNYARDSKGNLLSSKRRDLSLGVQGEVMYNITSFAGVYLGGEYNLKQSNSKYEPSFETNYEYFVIELGTEIKL